MPQRTFFKNFIKDRRAYVAVVFGILALPLIGIAGAAIDYRNIGREQNTIRTAAEAAAIALARSHFGVLDSGGGGNGMGLQCPPNCGGGGPEPEDSQTLMNNIFYANFTNDPAKFTYVTLAPVSIDETNKTVTVSATAGAKTSLLQVIGFSVFDISVSAKAAAVFSSENIDLHFVVDMSPSMGAPADGTPPPLDPATGCFFMCHDDGHVIRNAGKTPKMDVIFNKLYAQDGLGQVIGEAAENNPISITVTYEAHSFDHHLYVGVPGKRSALLRDYFTYSDLTTIAASGYYLGDDGVNGGTDLKTSFEELHTYLSVGNPKAANTRRIVIIVSDGMHARATQPFDPAVCTALKGDGDIFTLYVRTPESVYRNSNLTYQVPGGPYGGMQAVDTWRWNEINNGGSTDYGYYSGLNNAEALMRSCATKSEWAYQGETQTQLQDAITSMGEAITAPTIRVIN
jgi:hypothetical protein